MDIKPGIFERIAEYLNRVQALIAEERAAHFPSLPMPNVYLEHGRRYVRVAKFNGSQNMVHTFVDLTNGDVLKAAGWDGPTLKHPRSNVFDADYGMSGVTTHGAKYL